MSTKTLFFIGVIVSVIALALPSFAVAALRSDESPARHAVTKVLTSEDERAGLIDLEGKPSPEKTNVEVEKVTYRGKLAGDQERKAVLRQRLDAYVQRNEPLREEFQQPKYDGVTAELEANPEGTTQ